MAGDSAKIEDYLVNIVETVILDDYIRHKEPYDVNHEGIVLNDQWILTTAQNVEKYKGTGQGDGLKKIVLITDDKNTDYSKQVEKVIIHEERGDFDKNIALIKMKPGVNLLNGKPALKIADQRPGSTASATLYALMETDDAARTLSVRKFPVLYKNNERPDDKEQLFIHRIPEAWRIHIFGGPLIAEDGSLVGIYSREIPVMDAPDSMNDYVFEDLTNGKYLEWINGKLKE